MEKPKGIRLARRIGEAVSLNDIILISIESLSSNIVKLRIEAPEDIRINRCDSPYKDWIIEEAINRDLNFEPKKIPPYRLENPSVIKRGYGKHSGKFLSDVPSYFLHYVLSQELDRKEQRRNHIDKLIAEIEKRKHGVLKDGKTNSNFKH